MMSNDLQEGVLDGRYLPIYGPYANLDWTLAGRTYVGLKWRGRRPTDIWTSIKLASCHHCQILSEIILSTSWIIGV